MHPDLAAQAADLYRAEREREAQEERLAREARAEPRRGGTQELRKSRRGSKQERRRTGPDGAVEQRGSIGVRAVRSPARAVPRGRAR